MAEDKPTDDKSIKSPLEMDENIHGHEDQQKKIPYPKSVFFIVTNEFCERFSFYGMRTILSIYLTDILLFKETTSKIIFHVFAFLVYFFPTFGAMIADSWLGKFKTILYLSMIYSVGNILLALAATPPLNLPAVELSMIGLFIVAFGTGGIKPCVSAFGGDQFVLPQQELQLAKFFSMFYFAVNSGSFISTAITPILREDVHCFGQKSCYTLAFAIPGILMIISIVIFVIGRPLYKVNKPQGNMVIKVSKCVGHAIKTRSKLKKTVKKKHWLDYAEDKFGKELVDDIKSLFRVLFLYLPLPVFWALFDQQATGWTFQARRMNGDLGFYTILPDQMQVVNPLLILIFIPLFQYVIYPFFNKFNFLTSPLKRLGTGGTLVGVSFVMSASISLALEAQYPVLPEVGQGQLRIYNNLPCQLVINAQDLDENEITINQFDYYSNIDLKVSGELIIPYEYKCMSPTYKSDTFKIAEKEMSGYTFEADEMIHFIDDVEKDERAEPRVRTLINAKEVIEFEYRDSYDEAVVSSNSTDHSIQNTDVGEHVLYLNGKKVTTFEFKLGGVYAVLINMEGDVPEIQLVTVTQPNSIHMLWMIPQYIVITMGEIMYSITGLEFSYSQAPSSMKSVVGAGWYLTTAFGNLLVVIIEAIDPFENQSANFFLYAGIMFADMILFAIMAMSYQFVEKKDDDDSLYSDKVSSRSSKSSINNTGHHNAAFEKSKDEQ